MIPSFTLSFPKDLPPQRCKVDRVSGTITVDLSNCQLPNPLRNPFAPEYYCTDLCDACKAADRKEIAEGMCAAEIANIISDKLMAVVRKQMDGVKSKDVALKIMP